MYRKTTTVNAKEIERIALKLLNHQPKEYFRVLI